MGRIIQNLELQDVEITWGIYLEYIHHSNQYCQLPVLKSLETSFGSTKGSPLHVNLILFFIGFMIEGGFLCDCAPNRLWPRTLIK